MPRKKRIPLVHVRWVDSSSSRGWADLEDFKKEPMLLCESVGWLLDKDNKRLLLAASGCTNGDWAERQMIPMGCVQRIQHLSGVKK